MIERQRFRSGNASLRMRAIVSPMISFSATDPAVKTKVFFTASQKMRSWSKS
jgi:hypothetical protein